MVNLGSKPLENILKFVIGVVLVVLINQVAHFRFVRIDLTEDKRFTIKESTVELMESLDDVVYLEIFLEGDFPAEFQPLQRAIRESLEEFQTYAGSNIQFKFTDPDQANSGKSKNEYFQYLANNGIRPTNAIKTERGKKVEKLIFPGALVTYGGESVGVMLFKGNRGVPYLERINQSAEGVEYELALSIQKLTSGEKKKIAVITGHDEINGDDIASIKNVLIDSYQLFQVDLTKRKVLEGYDAILVVKPETSFSEADKYKIDQFIMSGGKALFFIDALRVRMDSAGDDGTLAVPYQLNLSDMLFKYGVRINNDLVQDLNSGVYPVITGYSGDQSQLRFLPWPFHPVINYFGDHPMVRNMDALSGRFVSSIDTVKASGIKKTPILYSSPYSRKMATPVRVSFNDFRQPPDPALFNAGPIPVAYLLEGEFTSAFKNKILPHGVESQNFQEQGNPSKILVCGDGDLIRNEISVENNQPLQLGFEQFTKETFANEDFVVNAINYLLDEDGLITARNKKITIRPLDKVKLESGKLGWQLFNLLGPLLLLILFGLGKYFMRKRKYARLAT